MYVVTRQGSWFRGREALVMFRRDTARTIGEPRVALADPEPLDLDPQGYDVTPQALVKLKGKVLHQKQKVEC